jgi:hypothetical protein
MSDVAQKMLGGSFADWFTTLRALDLETVDNDAFLGMLRPYFWYVHRPGFQDLHDSCAAALGILEAHADDLDDGYDYPGLKNFLEGYVRDEALNSTGWIFMGGSAEIAASVSAGSLAEKLAELGAPESEVAALKEVGTLMKRIEGTKHEAGNNIREIGDKHLEPLTAIIDTLHPNGQSFILHALDGNVGSADVIAFYKSFLERNPETPLRDEVGEYLTEVDR